MYSKLIVFGTCLLLSACEKSADPDAEIQREQRTANIVNQEINAGKVWQYRLIQQAKNRQVEVWTVFDQSAQYAEPSAQLVLRRDWSGQWRVEIVAENARFHCDRSYCPINVAFEGKTYIFYIDSALSTPIEQSTIVFRLDEADAFLAELRQADIIEVSADFFSTDLNKLIFNTKLPENTKNF